ncbi:MAG: decarboxylating 6-phosphogluconate dehydrogenase [Solirubrobacterales bacterium]|nr:decarboxylating 6-phosphogluconate dehydrogenase [Solirubrobacterales bacterium]MBV9716125.1 decarboxylating 6-phosphogluconate dehydrogenase [Solirubrobacterales bacterium]
MQMAMVGLGRMGANMVRRLIRDGHECVVYDVRAASVSAMEEEGAAGTGSLSELVEHLAAPRAIWVMVPAAFTDETIDQLAQVVEPGDILIDGGNSYFHDDIDRAERLEARGIHYVDVGTSGGVHGLERGYCLMIGGRPEAVQRLDPIFRSLAPGLGATERTPGREGEPSTAELGYLHCGPPGAGHFVKMVHNGIEYGVMAAYAEGLNILRHANIGTVEHESDAETAPVRDAQRYYAYDFEMPAVAEVWRRGSVIASWLLDLTAAALVESPELADFSGRVSDSGEGRWTIAAAVDEGVPANVLSASLFSRFSSRGEAEYGNKLLSAMRKQFGGHAEKRGAGV